MRADLEEEYYYWVGLNDSEITAKTEIIYDPDCGRYVISIAINGDIYLPWDDYEYNRSDSIRLEFQDDGLGNILLKFLYDFF
ncbi:MAG: hypothetical protein KAX49_18265 [Halanaerobiales bacterium]|nr:hypothetical protein [Halanaerobiales bacterium]